MQVLTDAEIASLRGYDGSINPRLVEQAVLSKLAEQQEPSKIYQYKLENGAWIDQDQISYDYNVKHGQATVRVVYLRPAPTQPYDQQALELCEACGWKTLIPPDECLNCERKPVQSAGLLAALKRAHAWMENQLDAQSKGGHATFDLMMLREERDAISDTLKATNPAPAQPVDDGAVREVREVMRLAGDYAIAYHEDVCLDGARKLLEAAIRKLAGGGV